MRLGQTQYSKYWQHKGSGFEIGRESQTVHNSAKIPGQHFMN